MNNILFIKDLLFELKKNKYSQYTFNGRSEFENKITLCILLFVSWIILYLTILINTFSFKFSMFFSLSILIFIFFILYKKFFENKNLKSIIENHLYIREKLYELIEYNNFYKVGLVNGMEGLKYSTKVFYRFLDNGFEIKIRLDGSRYQDKYFELEDKLYHLFGYRIYDVLVENGSYTYKFTFDKLEPIYVNDNLHGKLHNKCSDEILFFSNGLEWNFRKQPHALVTGVTGGGKTYILFWIIRNIFSYGSELKILDPKMADLDYLKNILPSNDVASSKGNIIRILRETSQLINDRNIEFQNHQNYSQGKDYKDYGYKPLFIIFDEVTAFFASCDSKESKEANGYLQEIVMKGRSAGVFVVLTTQRADADVISGKIRDQLGLRVGMGGLSVDGNVMTFGNEYRDLKLTIRGVVPGKARSGIGFIYIDGVTTKPQEFYAPCFYGNYDFFKDMSALIEVDN